MSEKARVDQLVAGFSDGDAISSEAMLLQDHLRALGYASDIYADHAYVTPGLKDRCRHYAEYRASERDALIFHFSIGSPVTDVFRKTAAKKIMRYHNITPAEFFRGFDDRVVQQLVGAREELKTLAGEADAVWAVSRFNAAEVQSFGVRAVDVLPLLFSPHEFEGPPDAAIRARFAIPMTNILFVGRMAPNKRVEDLIHAYAWYHDAINPLSRLIIVGSDRSCPRYFTMLRMLIGELNLLNVCLEGFVAPQSLSAYYAIADAFVCASEHEGFCLPLVEAMHHKVPVIARSIGGMPEALDGAGVLYDDLAPQQLAGLINLAITDAPLRAEILESQATRMRALAGRAVSAELQGLLQRVVGN